MGQHFCVDKVLDVVNHQEHDRLWYEISASFGDDSHVGIDQVSDRLHLSLQLRVDGSQGSILALIKMTLVAW